MWPDEQDASSSTHSTSPAPVSPRALQTNGGSGASSASEDSSSLPVPSRPIQVAHLAYPIVLSRHLQQMQADLHTVESPPEAASPSRDSGSEGSTTVVAISNTTDMLSDCCSKCSSREAENRQLRKRVQALEEQLCRALGTKKTKVVSTLEPMIAIKPQSLQFQPLRQTRTLDTYTVHPIQHRQDNTDVHATKVHVVESQQQTPLVPTKLDKKDDDKIELVPGSNVFISTARLQQILSVVKTGKQLARKLMSVYWDRIVLARSTLSASSQHYEQLDPSIISAIKTYCVLFDNTARKSEIHSTMIDKCVQARRPRRSSLKQQEHLSRELNYQEVTHVSPPFLVKSQSQQNDREDDQVDRDDN